MEGGAKGIWRVEARDIAKPPTMHETVPTTDRDLAPDDNRTEVEKV